MNFFLRWIYSISSNRDQKYSCYSRVSGKCLSCAQITLRIHLDSDGKFFHLSLKKGYFLVEETAVSSTRCHFFLLLWLILALTFLHINHFSKYINNCGDFMRAKKNKQSLRHEVIAEKFEYHLIPISSIK